MFREFWFRFKVAIVTFGVMLTAIGSVYGTAAALDFKIDRPAWHSELLQYTGYSLTREKRNLKSDLIQIDAHIMDLKTRRQPVPFFLQEQRDKLNRDLEAIQNLLKQRR